MARVFSRRKFLFGLAGATVGAAGAGAYARWFEPHRLGVSRVQVPLGREPAGPPVRVLQLSDFHASPEVSLDFIEQSVALGLAQRPDLIALTGDYFTNRLDCDVARYADILRRLPAAAPTFATLGNHDGGPSTGALGGYKTVAEALELLRAANIPCLHNAARELTLRGRRLQIFGVGDWWSRLCDPESAFARAPARGDAVRVLLNHNPDAKQRLRPFDWDLALCGHTHGGQVRLPFLGTPFAPVADKRYVDGLHRWEDRWLHITRGVGTLHGVRFNCPPEVSVIDLV